MYSLANAIWPGLIVGFGLAASWIIPVGLLFEYPFVKYLTRTSWRAALVPLLAINVASALAGIVIIPVGGLGLEIARALVAHGSGTFNPVTWTLTFLLALAANVAIEAIVLRYLSSVPASLRNLSILTVGNLGSIAVAIWLVASGMLDVN